MNTPQLKPSAIVGTILSMMFASFLVATPAHAETTMANEGQPAKYCAGVVQQVAPEISYSVVRQACSDESPAVAAALLDSAPALNSTDARNQQASADRIQIMTWYEGADFTGDSYDIYGEDGDCDGAGYEMHPQTGVFYFWGEVMSSARGANSCNVADFYNQALTVRQTFSMPVSNLGNDLNDNVGKIQIWNRDACSPAQGPC